MTTSEFTAPAFRCGILDGLEPWDTPLSELPGSGRLTGREARLYDAGRLVGSAVKAAM